MKRLVWMLCVCLFAATACGAPGPTDQRSSVRPSIPEPTPTVAPVSPRPPSSALTELPRPKASLAPGRYTKSSFTPSIGFTVGEGWSAQQVANGFFDIQQDPGSPDVIAVQFANVPGASLQAAIDAVTQRANVQVVEAGAATIDGHDGFRAIVETIDPPETDPPVFRPVLDTAAGPISIASGRRLLIMLFDAQPGIIAVLVGGSIANWDATLQTAQPVLDSITIGA